VGAGKGLTAVACRKGTVHGRQFSRGLKQTQSPTFLFIILKSKCRKCSNASS
jgi:hypothetical protein